MKWNDDDITGVNKNINADLTPDDVKRMLRRALREGKKCSGLVPDVLLMTVSAFENFILDKSIRRRRKSESIMGILGVPVEVLNYPKDVVLRAQELNRQHKNVAVVIAVGEEIDE